MHANFLYNMNTRQVEALARKTSIAFLPIQAIVQEFAHTAPLALAGLLALANVCFWVYDAALNNLIRAYALRMRPLLRRFL